MKASPEGQIHRFLLAVVVEWLRSDWQSEELKEQSDHPSDFNAEIPEEKVNFRESKSRNPVNCGSASAAKVKTLG